MRRLFIFSLVSLVFFAGCVKKDGKSGPGGVSTSAPPAVEEKGGEEGMSAAGKKILMIVSPTDFRDEELTVTKAVFEQAGAEVTVASKGVIEATGMLGARIEVDIDVSEASAADYDAVVFVGGLGATVYFDDPQAQTLAKDAYNQGKVVAAICIAPSVLANAGLLVGKRATVSPSEIDNLQAKGAVYSQEAVVIDGQIVTASGPEAAKEFGDKIVGLLSRG